MLAKISVNFLILADFHFSGVIRSKIAFTLKTDFNITDIFRILRQIAKL